MGNVRLQRLNSLIGETVAELLVKKSKDPRLSMVTITRAAVSPDLRKVRLYYGVMGDAEALAKASAALDGARGFVRAALYDALTLKRVPEVVFEHDRNLAYASRINELIAGLRPREAEGGSDGTGGGSGGLWPGEGDPEKPGPGAPGPVLGSDSGPGDSGPFSEASPEAPSASPEAIRDPAPEPAPTSAPNPADTDAAAESGGGRDPASTIVSRLK